MEKFLKLLDSKKSNATEGESTTGVDLQIPLKKGWRRETIFENVTSECEIEGDVCYYSPGSQRKLRSIEQIQRVS